MSVKVGGNPTRREAEDIAGIWETGLWNNHVHADRFMLGDDTAAYLFKVRINLYTRAQNVWSGWPVYEVK